MRTRKRLSSRLSLLNTMAIRLLAILLAFGTGQTASFAGGDSGREAGNGGDFVRCTPHPDGINPFDGLYSMDYVVTYNYENDNEDIDVYSWEEMSKKLLVLAEKVPIWGDKIRTFLDDIGNTTNYGKNHIWLPRGKVTEVNDEYRDELPDNCQTVIQAIQFNVRITGLKVYSYNAPLMKEAEKIPGQVSFKRTHELLWKFTDNVQFLYEGVRYLHASAVWMAKEGLELVRDLSRIGLMGQSDYQEYLEYRRRVLMEDIAAGNLEGVQAYLRNGGDPNFAVYPDYYCNNGRCSGKLRTLLEENKQFQTRYLASSNLIFEISPLALAYLAHDPSTLPDTSKDGRPSEIVAALTEAGASLEDELFAFTGKYKWYQYCRALLGIAIERGRTDIAHAFLDAGLDLSEETRAVPLAIEIGDFALAEALVARNAPTKNLVYERESPLYRSIEAKDLSTFAMIASSTGIDLIEGFYAEDVFEAAFSADAVSILHYLDTQGYNISIYRGAQRSLTIDHGDGKNKYTLRLDDLPNLDGNKALRAIFRGKPGFFRLLFYLYPELKEKRFRGLKTYTTRGRRRTEVFEANLAWIAREKKRDPRSNREGYKSQLDEILEVLEGIDPEYERVKGL